MNRRDPARAPTAPGGQPSIDWGVEFDDALIRFLNVGAEPDVESKARLVTLFSPGSHDPLLIVWTDDRAEHDLSVAMLEGTLVEPMMRWWSGTRDQAFAIGSPTWYRIGKVEKKNLKEIRQGVDGVGRVGVPTVSHARTGRDGLQVTTWLWSGDRRSRSVWSAFDHRGRDADVALFLALLEAVSRLPALDAVTHPLRKSLRDGR